MIPFLSFEHQNEIYKDFFLEKISTFLDTKNYVLGKKLKPLKKIIRTLQNQNSQ